jgi:hypothetical protein
MKHHILAPLCRRHNFCECQRDVSVRCYNAHAGVSVTEPRDPAASSIGFPSRFSTYATLSPNGRRGVAWPNVLFPTASFRWATRVRWTGAWVERVSFKEEVDTLQALGLRGLRVPKPFDNGAQAEYRFAITVYNDGEEPKVPAFFQEFMSRDEFVEMTKTTPRERDEFAKHHIVTGGRVPATIEATITDLKKIQAELNSAPWGDFQVMYEKRTGRLIVFDPLPTDPNAAAYKHSVATWLKDIEEAMSVSKRLQKTVEDLMAKNKQGGQLLRRHSLS